MKISEVIKELQRLKEKHGDLPVYRMDTEYGDDDVHEIEFETSTVKSPVNYGIPYPDRVTIR